MRVANAVSNSSSSRKAKFKKSCLDRYFKMNSDEICSWVFLACEKENDDEISSNLKEGRGG